MIKNCGIGYEIKENNETNEGVGKNSSDSLSSPGSFHRLNGGLLLGAGCEDEGQDALHFDGDAVGGRRSKDPLIRRINGCSPQGQVSTDGLGFNHITIF
jgi:hypothetical protein